MRFNRGVDNTTVFQRSANVLNCGPGETLTSNPHLSESDRCGFRLIFQGRPKATALGGTAMELQRRSNSFNENKLFFHCGGLWSRIFDGVKRI